MSSDKASLYHSLLDYVVTRAIVKGETGSMKLTIPLKNLAPDPSKVENINLLIKIESNWTDLEALPRFNKTVQELDDEDYYYEPSDEEE